MSHPAYPLMLAEAAKRGLPLHYRDDLLVHDERWLNENLPTTCFAWGLYECGTHTVMCNASDAIKFAKMIDTTFRICHWFFWDGKSLDWCDTADWLVARMEKAIDRLPKFGMKCRAGEVTIKAIDAEVAAILLKKKLNESYWLYADSHSGVYAVA